MVRFASSREEGIAQLTLRAKVLGVANPAPSVAPTLDLSRRSFFQLARIKRSPTPITLQTTSMPLPARRLQLLSEIDRLPAARTERRAGPCSASVRHGRAESKAVDAGREAG